MAGPIVLANSCTWTAKGLPSLRTKSVRKDRPSPRKAKPNNNMIRNGPRIRVRIRRGWRKTVASSLRRNVVERTIKRERLPIYLCPMFLDQFYKHIVIGG